MNIGLVFDLDAQEIKLHGTYLNKFHYLKYVCWEYIPIYGNIKENKVRGLWFTLKLRKCLLKIVYSNP